MWHWSHNIFVCILIQTINCSLYLYSGSSSLSCVQVLTDSQMVSSHYVIFVKQSKKLINISRNETFLEKTLPTFPTCLVYSLNPSPQTQSLLSALKRHLIIVEAINCKDMVASQFNVDLYCVEENTIHEKYSVRSNTVFRKLEILQTEVCKEIRSARGW